MPSGNNWTLPPPLTASPVAMEEVVANNIREMYVSVPDGVVLYASRDQCNVLSKKDKDGTSRPHYYTLNETGLRILAQVDGSKRTSCLIEEFRSSS